MVSLMNLMREQLLVCTPLQTVAQDLLRKLISPNIKNFIWKYFKLFRIALGCFQIVSIAKGPNPFLYLEKIALNVFNYHVKYYCTHTKSLIFLGF